VNPQQPGLSFSTDPAWTVGRLRADRIRRGTLTGLVADWHETDQHGVSGRDATIAALDALAEAVRSPRDEHEVDARVDDVETAAGLDYVVLDLDLGSLLQLRDGLDEAIRRLARFNPAEATRKVSLLRDTGRAA
jgi:hypothetical protein